MASMFLADIIDDSNPTSDASGVKTKMTITLNHDNPITLVPRKLSVSENKKLKAIIDDLLKKGHIRPSTSSYASAAMLIESKTKEEYNLLVDYSKLNEATVRETYPPRDISVTCEQLAYNKLYSRYRLEKDYHLVKMAEDSIKYTSFVTNFGQFEYLVMPRGLMNSYCFFLKFLDEIFRPMIDRNLIVLHLEDILIGTQDYGRHLDIMRKMNNTIARHGLRVRKRKSYSMESKMIFMRFMIDLSGAEYCGFSGSDDECDSSDDSLKL